MTYLENYLLNIEYWCELFREFFKGFICIHILVMMDPRHTDAEDEQFLLMAAIPTYIWICPVMELSHHLFRMTLLLSKVLMYISQLYLFVVTIIFSSESIWILWMFFYSRLDHRRSRKRRSEAQQKTGRAVHYNGSWSRWRTDRSRSCRQKIHKTIRMYCQGPHPDQFQALESFQSKRGMGCGTRKRKRMVLAGA